MVLGIVFKSVKKKQFLTVDGRIAASGNEIEATVKFWKEAPGIIFFKGLIWRGFYMEGLIEGILSIGYCAFPVLCPQPSP